jgi:hypothetical protein
VLVWLLAQEVLMQYGELHDEDFSRPFAQEGEHSS